METQEFTPPYIPFRTLLNMLERLADNGVPGRIDRTYLNYLSGITQSYLLSALRAFNFIDSEAVPTDKLKDLVQYPDRRSELIGDLVRSYYQDALVLGGNATHGQLEEVFREKYDLRGETNRKAITFFLNAAKFGNVELSPHYKMPRAAGGGGGSTRTGAVRRTTRRRTTRQDQPITPATSGMDSLRTRYVEMLMQKAETQDQMDSELLDRIEALLGYEGSEAREEAEEEE